MNNDDTFWKQNFGNIASSQEMLFEHLNKSDHLKETIYSPGILTGKEAPTTIRISGKKFEFVSFAKTTISEIIFRDCIFENCLFIDARITNCEFHDCEFIFSNTHKIQFSQTYINPLSFSRCLDQDKHQNVGVHLYQNLFNNSRNIEQVEFERDAQFYFLRWKRFQELYGLKKLWNGHGKWSRRKKIFEKFFSYIRRWMWEKICGSGLRIRYFFLTVLGTLSVFSLLNFYFRDELGLRQGDQAISTCIEAVYFTVISFTTLGYGDIVPTSEIGRVVAAGQGAIGFCLFALLASMLYRKVSP